MQAVRSIDGVCWGAESIEMAFWQYGKSGNHLQCYAYCTWNGISGSDSRGIEELLLLFSSLMIGGPAEIQCHSVDVAYPCNARAVLKQIYVKPNQGSSNTRVRFTSCYK